MGVEANASGSMFAISCFQELGVATDEVVFGIMSIASEVWISSSLPWSSAISGLTRFSRPSGRRSLEIRLYYTGR